MAIRYWLTAEDIANVTIATPDPFAETLYSIIPLRAMGVGCPQFRPWLAELTPRLTPDLTSVLAMFPAHPILDLASVAGRTTSFDAGADQVLARPRAVANELRIFADEHGGVPRQLHRLAQADRGAYRTLVDLLSAYHDQAVSPYWCRVQAALASERLKATQVLADHGVAGLFARLAGAGLQWDPPVLTLESTRARNVDKDSYLDGRGLCLAPSVFFGRRAASFADYTVDDRATIVYSIQALDEPIHELWSHPDDRGPALSALLGRTRARVLDVVADGATTTALARRVGCSLSTASEHARALREAGLVESWRDGPSIIHSATDLGMRMLNRYA